MRARVARLASFGRRTATLPLLLLLGAASSAPAPLVGQTGVVLAAHVGSTAAVPGGVAVDGASEVRQGFRGLRVPYIGAAFGGYDPTVFAGSATAEEIAAAAISSAERLIGTRYRWGAASPRRGFDCSGFVQYVFRQQGVELPRVSRTQARAGIRLETGLDGLAKGDLLFFALRGSSVDHVAIYAGDDRMVHSSSSGRGVRYDDLTSDRGRWYARRLVAVRRVIVDRGVLVREVPAQERTPRVSRSLPLGEALETITGESADDHAPPPGR